MADQPARRRILKAMVAGLAAGALSGARRAWAQDNPERPKISKADARYVDEAESLRCQDCSAYLPGSERDNGTCAIVEGLVKRRGGCIFFDA